MYKRKMTGTLALMGIGFKEKGKTEQEMKFFEKYEKFYGCFFCIMKAI